MDETRTFKLKPGTTAKDIEGVFDRLCQALADASGTPAVHEVDGGPKKVFVPSERVGKASE